MRKLIINADDLGISPEVDQMIEKCIKLGVITSSTLISNGPSFEEGVRIAKQYPNISVGVHLNIIEFTPLTNLEVFRNHGVVDKEGHFIEGAIYNITIDNELCEAIFEEWDAQITKVEQVGIVPTHCDSHQHTHAIFALQDVLDRVLKKHNISKVRRKAIPSIRLMLREKNRPKIQFNRNNAGYPKKRNVMYRRLHLFTVIRDCKRWNLYMEKKYRMTNSFFAFRNFYFDREILRLGGTSAVIELMCHPGHPAYQKETDSLICDFSWLPENYKLISYKEL